MKIRKNGKTITLSESDMRIIVKKLLRESVDPETAVLDCIKENTTLTDLTEIPEACVTMIVDKDVTKALECGTSMNPKTAKIILSKIEPISRCVAGKMGGSDGDRVKVPGTTGGSY